MFPLTSIDTFITNQSATYLSKISKYVPYIFYRNIAKKYIFELGWTQNWFCENASQSSLMKYPSELRLKVKLTVGAQLPLIDEKGVEKENIFK